MKSKLLLSILVIFLVLTFIGCGTVPCCPDWVRAEQEVYSYWRAITNRQYELAKGYCVPDGVWYNKVDEWEEYINTNSEGEASILISKAYFHEQTEIIGDIAVVYTTIYVDKIAFPGSYLWEGDTFEYEIELIRSLRGFWKLK
ncbi:hypothetical protein CVT91_09675 [Candidatus Atribacteria bacterium HGW-Atribacteria-1]|nr:MAG: hypothetical protein CVT91_09675 [Candidatus Atribacteria bacterium HGW-Atribacteria-1]